MIRLLSVIVAVFACASASAWESIPLDRGIMLVDSLSAGVRTMTFHARAKVLSRGQAEWGIVWNYSSEADYRGLDVMFKGKGDADNVFPDEIRVTEYEVSAGVRRELSEDGYCGAFSPRGDGFSLRLKVTPSGAMVSGGTSAPVFEIPVAFNVRNVGGIGLAARSPLSVMRKTVDYVAAAEPAYSCITDIDAYLSATADPNECYWKYFDRDTDPLRANPGGAYTLATVGDGAGGYLVLYIDGARVNKDFWQPLQIKGRLVPTVFQGHYDLWWLDSYGEEMTAEQSATIDNASLLTLHFPLYEATIRFSRAVK